MIYLFLISVINFLNIEEDPEKICEPADSNLCIVNHTQSKSILIESKEDGSPLYVLFQDLADDYTINISQLNVRGQVFITSNRKLTINIIDDLTINGNVVFDNFYISVSTLNIQNNSNFITNSISASNINLDCDENFTCSTIKVQNFYCLEQDQLNIQINEVTNFESVNKTSTILTILSGNPPRINFNSSSIDFYTEYYSSDADSDSLLSDQDEKGQIFSLSVKYLACKIPEYYNVTTHQCEQCPYNQSPISDGSTECSLCPEGSSYSNESRRCVSCKPGEYLDQNTLQCTLCPFGTYQPDSNQITCIQCPQNSSTINQGETSINSCVCPAGYYGHSGNVCHQCLEDDNCEFGSIYPRSNPGFWIDENNFYYSVVCQPKYACLGNSACEKGYEGKFCGTCSKGYFRLHQGCVKCNKAVPPILAIIMILFLVLLFYLSAIDNYKLFPMFMITVQFYQEISMFSFLNSTERIHSSKFLSYLSFLYFNPQIFQPQCYGLHSWSLSVQLAILFPVLIAVILFLCSVLSWFIPCLIKFSKRADKSFKVFWKMGYFNFKFLDCIKLFKVSVIGSFYVFFPAYFGLVIRTIKFSDLTVSKTKYLDFEPSSIFDDPNFNPAKVSTIIVLTILLAFLICFDLYLIYYLYRIKKEPDDKKETYKIIWGQKDTIKKSPFYYDLYTKSYWTLLIHLKFSLMFIFWIYLQKFLLFQYGFFLCLYFVYLFLQMIFSPFKIAQYNKMQFVSDLFKFIVVFVACSQFSDNGGSKAINAALIIVCILYILYLLYFCLKDLIWNKIKDYSDQKKRLEKEHYSSKNGNDNELFENINKEQTSDNLINTFIDGKMDTIIKLLKITNITDKLFFLETFNSFDDYVHNSKQDLRKYHMFINNELKPFFSGFVSDVILNKPTLYTMMLDRIADKLLAMHEEKNNNNKDSVSFVDKINS